MWWLLYPGHQIGTYGNTDAWQIRYDAQSISGTEQTDAFQRYGFDGNVVFTSVGSAADLWEANVVADGGIVGEESGSRQGNTAACMGSTYE